MFLPYKDHIIRIKIVELSIEYELKYLDTHTLDEI